MKQPGQIVLFRFPQTDLAVGKLRPALLLGRLPGGYDDWLIYQGRESVPKILIYGTSHRNQIMARWRLVETVRLSDDG